jgi:hypothetical protein
MKGFIAAGFSVVCMLHSANKLTVILVQVSQISGEVGGGNSVGFLAGFWKNGLLPHNPSFQGKEADSCSLPFRSSLSYSN